MTRAANAIRFPCETHVLDNGLTVVLSEDHAVPLVAVQVMYRVGSKHAPAGKTGLPHLLEHLFFQGSAHVPREAHFRRIEETGGTTNASTWFDCTSFYSTVPANELELVLWLEADRMGFLDAGLTQESLDTQRRVIRNERLQNLENQPFGGAMEALLATAFPPGHPYSHHPVGRVEDLARVSLDELTDFYRCHYGPSNAVVVLCGDFDGEEALASVERYFGGLDPRPAPPPPELPPTTAGDGRRRTIEDRVHAPRLYLLHEAPSYRDPEYESADVLTVLFSQGQSARLQRELVYRRRLASDVASFMWLTADVGMFFIIATAIPGRPIDGLESALEESFAALLRDGISPEELDGSLTWGRLSLVSQLHGVAGRADALAHAATLKGAPEYVNEAFGRYAAVTAEDVERVARRLLAPAARSVLHVVPHGSAAGAEVSGPPVPSTVGG